MSLYSNSEDDRLGFTKFRKRNPAELSAMEVAMSPTRMAV
jgi:hypothetical protein